MAESLLVGRNIVSGICKLILILLFTYLPKKTFFKNFLKKLQKP